MSQLANDSTIMIINNINSQCRRYITLLVVLFGTTGNLLNMIVFLQPLLRRNPCGLYFLSSSAAGLGILLAGLPSHIIGEWISSDPTSSNPWYCKLRIFSSVAIPQTFLCAKYYLYVKKSCKRHVTGFEITNNAGNILE